MRQGFVLAGLVVVASSLLVLPFRALPEISTPSWAAFLGRMHPLVIHFPIVLIPLLSTLEALGRWHVLALSEKWMHRAWGGVMGVVLFSVLAGYLLLASGDYGGEIVRDHLWGAVITALLVVLIGVMRWMRWLKTIPTSGLLALLVAINLAVVFTGHQGGMLTHGEGYLSEAVPVRSAEVHRPDKPLAEWEVLNELVLPVLDLRCVSCHNASKSRGRLQLTTYDHLMAGGKSGLVLAVPHHADSSELIRRVSLPVDHDDVMPPSGRTPLSSIEQDILRWWVDAGAQVDMRYAAGPADSLLNSRIQAYLPTLLGARQQKRLARGAFRAMLADLQREASNWGLVVDVNADSDSTLVDVRMQIPPKGVDDDAVAELSRYAPHIARLSLVSSEISDNALYYIGHMTNLEALYVANTRIEGEGLVYLKALSRLEVLNLANTEVTGDALMLLSEFEALQDVYVFNAEAEAAVIEALQVYRPGISFRQEIGPLGG